MAHRFVPSRKSLRAFAISGAWFFIVVSLAHLLWAIGQKWSDPAGTFKLYHAIVDGRSYDAWGLTYTGTLGLLTVLGQTLVVAAALAASVLPWQRSLRYRRIGHGVLCGWAALWALNLIWLATVDLQPYSIAQATLLCLLLGCTGYRATTGWSPGRSTTPPKPMVNPAESPRVKAFVSATRQRTAAGLSRVGDFAHKQAQRIAIR
jgi:hypothetical protein